MRDQLLGAMQPVLSISLDPGESVVAEVGQFAWMTDSIEMAAAGAAQHEPWLCVYTATGEPGVVAFASRLPGSILSVDIGPGCEGRLVRESSFLAGTPGVQVAADTGPVTSGPPDGDRLALWRIGGTGRAWVQLPGDVVRRELTAGQSLRAHPGHIGMVDTTITIQVTQVRDVPGRDAYPCAVLSGPGVVWLRSMPVSAGLERGTTARSA
ncbi:MAG TPA: AIM24 family protein [Streptosporangiaceae bacterium]|nr:AIM24 family protein [Streptosporangiaceae bacterium]